VPALPAFLAAAFLALAQGEVPANDGWVTDLAGMLRPEEERALEARMESYRAGSGQDIALLTVPDLGGRAIEDFALAVARAWKIGDRETSSGALLVVARAERALRIEAGRGLEGTLTDSVAGRIIRDVIVPEFRSERYADGLRKGIAAIHAALGGDYGPLEDAERTSEAPLTLALEALFTIVLFLALGSVFRSRGRLRGPSVLPWILASQLGSARGYPRGGFGGGFGRSGGGGFRGFGGGGGFSGGGASGRW
jgi:uncharacterized protein